MTTYISATETAKLIRKVLKAEFPHIKFSVKQTRGGSLRIEYTGDLAPKKVEELTYMFEGTSFDSMQDLASPRFITNEDGEQIHYGIDYIFVSRHFADDSEVEKFNEHFSWIENDHMRRERAWREMCKFDNYAEFTAYEKSEAEAIEANYQKRLAEESKQDALEAAIDEVLAPLLTDAPVTVAAPSAPVIEPVIEAEDDYVACLMAAGWIDAELSEAPIQAEPFRMTEIKIQWSESPDIAPNETFTTFAAFNNRMRQVARLDTKKTGAYDKTGFLVTFSDSDTYAGQADLNYLEVDFDLVERMIHFIEFHLSPEANDLNAFLLSRKNITLEDYHAELRNDLAKYKQLRGQA